MSESTQQETMMGSVQSNDNKNGMIAYLSRVDLDLITKLLYGFCLAAHVFYFLQDPIQSNLYQAESISPIVSFISEKLENYLVIVLFIVLILDLTKHKPSFLRIAIIVVGGLIVQWVSIKHPDFYLSTLYWLIISYPRSLEPRSAALIVFTSGMIVSALLIILALTGEIANNIRYEHGTLRYGFGFMVGYYLSSNMTMFLMAWMFAMTSRWKPIYYAIGFSAALVIFAVGNGRAAFYCAIAFLIGIAIWRSSLLKEKPRALLSRIVKFLGAYTFAVLALVSLLAGCFVDATDSNLVPLNSLLGGFIQSRVIYWNMAVQELGVSLLGSGVQAANSLDCTYLYVALRYGMLILVALCLLFVICGRRFDSKRDYYTLLLIILLSVFAFSTRYMCIPANNISLLLLGECIGRFTAFDETTWENNGAHIHKDTTSHPLVFDQSDHLDNHFLNAKHYKETTIIDGENAGNGLSAPKGPTVS